MPANAWELRADVRPLEAAATRWTELATLMARRGEEIVEAARRATEGWDAAAAESYEQHRRQVLVNLDRFTTLATQVAGSLRAISAILTSSQQELDRAWTTVALVPHEIVGESRYLVFTPEDDEGRGKVDTGLAETDEIRRRLALSLDQESARLRASRAEFVMVRTELTNLTGGTFGRRPGPGVGPGFGPGGEESGVGTILLPSTSVLGSSQSGLAASALPPVAPISVSMPTLGGLSAAALAPLGATAASGLARAARRRTANPPTPPIGGMGGMGAGAMGARAGTMSRGTASARSGGRRMPTPTLAGSSEEEAARIAREKQAAKQAEKEAKQAALADRRAERAARRAEREKDKEATQSREPTDEPDDDPGARPAAITVVQFAPGEEPVTHHAPGADRKVDAEDEGGVRRS